LIYDLIIIGGGAAGLFAAANAPAGKVLLLEKMSSTGKKILISGGGMCNLTNGDKPEQFIQSFGSKKKANFLKPALFGLSPSETIDWFEERGLDLVSREDGKVFPASLKADSLVSFLMKEAGKRGVEYIKSAPVTAITPSDKCFEVIADSTSYRSRFVLLAAGGKSFPGTGSDGTAYELARSLGHKIIDPTQALASVHVESYGLSSLAGSSLKSVPVDFYHRDETKRYLQSRGDILFTHNGLSGPVILNNSRFVRSGDRLDICLVSGENREVIRESLLSEWNVQGRKSVKSFLKSVGIFSALADHLIGEAGIKEGSLCSSIDKKAKNRLISLLVHFPQTVSRKASFSSAMATAGGVDISQIDRKNMESKVIPGLFFAGEILDIDGDTGGYNIQAAFSTAFAAVKSLSERIG